MVNYKRLFFISLAISLVSALIIILMTTDAQTIEALKQIRIEYILLALLLQIVTYLISARKAKSLLRSLGYYIRTRETLVNELTGILFASLTPSSIGGEPLRILLLRKNNKVPVGKATAVVFMERFLDAFFVFLCLIPSMFLLRVFLMEEGKGVFGIDALLFVGIVCLFILLVVLIYIIFNPDFAKKRSRQILLFLSKRLPQKYHPRIEKLIIVSESEIDMFHTSFKRFISIGKVNLLIAVGYTVIYWIVRLAVLWMVLLGLNVTPDLMLLFATQIILTIIMIIPATPGASGVTEFAAYTLYSLFVPVSLVGVAVISWRAITYYVNIIAGTIASLKMLRKYGINALSKNIEMEKDL
ncbi:MAG: flippase-like domain-containing protein [Methanimicrococcus sp.]|nr:flippase-like domain-containing protein [Methanimicrococcus sp.]